MHIANVGNVPRTVGLWTDFIGAKFRNTSVAFDSLATSTRCPAFRLRIMRLVHAPAAAESNKRELKAWRVSPMRLRIAGLIHAGKPLPIAGLAAD